MRQTGTWWRRMVAVGAGMLVLTACGSAGGTGTDGVGTSTEDQQATGDGSHDPVTLTVGTSFPEDAVEHDGFWVFADRLEENAPWIEVQYRGGPDVFDPLQLVESATSGAVDIVTLPQSFYVQQAPIAELMSMTPYLPSEERENGVFEIYQEWHRSALNLEYLGKVYAGVPMQLFTKEPMDGADLGGRTMRVSAAATAVVQALDGEVVNLPAGEVYTALERGVVDGFGWASIGVAPNGWDELVGYSIEPRFADATISVLINADVWDGLDQDTRDAISQTMIEVEPEIVDLYRRLGEEEFQTYLDNGVEVIRLDGEDAEAVLRGHYEHGYQVAGYDEIVQEFPIAEEMRELYEQGYGESFQNAVVGPMYYSDL